MVRKVTRKNRSRKRKVERKREKKISQVTRAKKRRGRGGGLGKGWFRRTKKSAHKCDANMKDIEYPDLEYPDLEYPDKWSLDTWGSKLAEFNKLKAEVERSNADNDRSTSLPKSRPKSRSKSRSKSHESKLFEQFNDIVGKFKNQMTYIINMRKVRSNTDTDMWTLFLELLNDLTIPKDNTTLDVNSKLQDIRHVLTHFDANVKLFPFHYYDEIANQEFEKIWSITQELNSKAREINVLEPDLNSVMIDTQWDAPGNTANVYYRDANYRGVSIDGIRYNVGSREFDAQSERRVRRAQKAACAAVTSRMRKKGKKNRLRNLSSCSNPDDVKELFTI